VAEDLASLHGDQHVMTGLGQRCEPDLPVLDAGGFEIDSEHGVSDVVPVDRRDPGGVPEVRRPDLQQPTHPFDGRTRESGRSRPWAWCRAIA